MARPKSEMGDIRKSPRSVRILKFLRRKPQPARIVGETLDGEEIQSAVNVTGSSTWTDVLSCVRSCVLLKALDKEGAELRRLTLDPDDPELRAESEMEQALAGVAQHAAVPIISVDVPKLVDNIARNIREVAMEAARANAGAHKEGFAAMVSVVNIALGLLVGVEQRLARAEQQLEAAHVPSDDPDANRQQLAMLALQRAMGGGNGAAAPNGGAVDPAALMQLMQSLQQQQQEPEE